MRTQEFHKHFEIVSSNFCIPRRPLANYQSFYASRKISSQTFFVVDQTALSGQIFIAFSKSKCASFCPHNPTRFFFSLAYQTKYDNCGSELLCLIFLGLLTILLLIVSVAKGFDGSIFFSLIIWIF